MLLPSVSLTVIVVLPPPTGVTENVAVVVASVRTDCTRDEDDDGDETSATVATLVFAETALKVPS
jgi:hypothetical protein